MVVIALGTSANPLIQSTTPGSERKFVSSTTSSAPTASRAKRYCSMLARRNR